MGTSAYLRRIALVAALAFTALVLARAIVVVSGGFTLGTLMRTLLPVAAGMAAVTLVAASDFAGGGFAVLWPRVGARSVLLLGAAGLLTAYAVVALSKLPGFSGAAQMSGFTNFVLLIGILVGLLLSLGQAIANKGAQAVASFLLIYPFLSWWEWQFRRFPQFSGGPWGPIVVTPMIVSLCLLLGALLIGRMINKEELLRTPLDKYMVLFIVVLLFSALASADPTVSFRGFFLDGLVFPLFFILIINTVHTKEDVILVLGAWVAGIILRELMTLYFGQQSAPAEELLEMFRAPTIYGATYYSASMAVLGLQTVPLAISLWAVSRGMVRSHLYAAGALFLLALVFVVRERSPVVALVLTIPLVLGYDREVRNALLRGLLALALVGLLLFVLWPTLRHTLLGRFDPWRSLQGLLIDQEMRLDGWRAALAMMRDHPLFGIGHGMWMRYILRYSKTSEPRMFLNFAHNLFLDYGTTAGIGGLITLVVLIIMVVREGLHVRRTATDGQLRALAVGLLWAFVAFAVLGGIGGASSLIITVAPDSPEPYGTNAILDNGLFFWAIAGLIFALGRLVREDLGDKSSRPLGDMKTLSSERWDVARRG